MPTTFPLDRAATASERLRCPLCTGSLKQDPWWLSPHWICEQGHSYSNVRVLTDELRERGWLTREAELALVHAAGTSSGGAATARW
jgi:hypothetical protein